MNTRLSVFFLTLLLASAWAVADTITVGGTTYENVYVTKGSTLYYVSNPQDGTVFNVPLDKASGVTITEDRQARSAIYQEWQKKNNERRGITEMVSADTAAPSETPAEPIDTSKPLKPIKKGVSEDYDSPPQISHSSTGTYNPLAYQQRMYEMQRNAQIAAMRQQRESSKMQRLRNVRVITSQDVAGRGGMGGGGMGGYGGGGMGGGYGGGYGGRR